MGKKLITPYIAAHEQTPSSNCGDGPAVLYMLRHASLNRTVLAAMRIVSSLKPTQWFRPGLLCAHIYTMCLYEKKLRYATRGVPYVSCSR